MTTSADIVNRALFLLGNNTPPVTGSLPNFDGTEQGIAAGVLYASVVQTVGRLYGFDFARRQGTLSVSGNVAPEQWTQEYLYPGNGLEIRQLLPGSITDPNNPVPVRWTVANANVGGNQTKVIWANITGAIAAFTNQPPEGLWDAGFAESVVRMLASELAQALSGKPETSKLLLESAQTFEQFAETRNG